jgi:hypothetical protein
MRLTHWCPFFLVAVLFVGMPQVADAQTFSYAVTATLNPEPPLPSWWYWDRSLPPMEELYRGLDGYMYAFQYLESPPHGFDVITVITRISPTTGEAQLLYVRRQVGAFQ